MEEDIIEELEKHVQIPEFLKEFIRENFDYNEPIAHDDGVTIALYSKKDRFISYKVWKVMLQIEIPNGKPVRFTINCSYGGDIIGIITDHIPKFVKIWQLTKEY